MTKSGYPFVVKLWKRGQPLDQAKEVFRGTPPTSAPAQAPSTTARAITAVLFTRAVNFFQCEVSLHTPEGPKRIAIPGKSEIHGMLDGQLIVELNEDWKPEGLTTTIPQGAIVALDLEAVRKDPGHLKPRSSSHPTAQEFAQEVGVTRNHLILTTLENVQGRAYVYTRSPKNVWTRRSWISRTTSASPSKPPTPPTIASSS